MIVPVTVFHLPNGRRTEETTELDDSAWAGYDLMTAHGLRLTAEVLSTGQVSLCVEHPGLGDLDCTVVANGPNVPLALERMLKGLTPSGIEAFVETMS